jgi:IstB-like ATP binding protein
MNMGPYLIGSRPPRRIDEGQVLSRVSITSNKADLAPQFKKLIVKPAEFRGLPVAESETVGKLGQTADRRRTRLRAIHRCWFGTAVRGVQSTLCGATLVTSNLPFDEWTSIFGSERLTGALLDRLTHHVHILEMNGESFRVNTSKKAQRRQGQALNAVTKQTTGGATTTKT